MAKRERPGGRRRMVRRVLTTLVAVLVVAAIGGYWYQRPLLLTGTGYAAHNACALQWIAGRENAADDLPPNPLVPVLRTGRDGERVTGSILGVLARQPAQHRAGFGCVLGDDVPDLGTATPVEPAANPFTAAATPQSDAALTEAVAAAFGDDLPEADRERLGTRAVVVVHEGRLVAERYAEGFAADTPQLGWSMSKSVANLLVGRLVQQGVVAVDDAGLRPEWTGDKAAITLDQLMRMTSGLSWDETYALGTPVTRMLYREGDMGGYAAGLDLAHPPGTYLQYSSGSTNVLCDYLAARTGAGADLPRRQLFAGLGLSSAVWEPDASGTPVCSSYLWATPRDWAALGQFALQDGEWDGERLLPEGWMARSCTMQPVPTSEEAGYAAGWWVNRSPDAAVIFPELPPDACWMQGHDGQRVVVVPSADLVVVRMGFSPAVESAELRVFPLVADLVTALG